MHSRGYSDVFQVLISLVALAIVILGTLNLTANVDTGFIQRTLVTQNVAFITSAMSFLPGNGEFVFFGEDDGMNHWDTFSLQAGSTFEYKDPERENIDPSTYKTFLNSQFLIQPYFTNTENNFAYVQKLYNVPGKHGVVLYEGAPNDMQLRCRGTEIRSDWPLHLENGGEDHQFYSQSGNLVEEIPEVMYDGMEQQFSVDEKRVYSGNPGLFIGSMSEGEVLRNMAADLATSYTHQEYVPTDVLEESHFVIGISEENKNGIVAFVSTDDYDVQYETSCQFINGLLHDEQIIGIERVAIVPYDGDHLVVEMGSIKHPDFFNEKNMDRFTIHLDLFTGGPVDAVV